VTAKLRVDIPILLPGIPGADDACVARLTSELQSREGVEKAHVATKPGEPAQLCVHYDPNVVTLARIRELARSTGARITEQFGHVLWRVEGISHQRRARTISDRLCGVPGVLEAEASVGGWVRVEFDRTLGSERAIRDMLSRMGVSVTAAAHLPERASLSDATTAREKHDAHDHGADRQGKGGGHSHSHGAFLGGNTELIFALACGAFLGIGFAAARLLAAQPGWVPTACYLAAYFFGGFFTVREAIENLRLGKFEIDTLMLVAAAGAAALGAFAEGALLLFLFSLGHALEHYAMGRAKQAIEALAELAPRTATVRRDGGTHEVPVEELVLGDVVVVRPNERLPADGFVVKGESSVNQAPVTGESIPVDKRPVDDIDAARARPASMDASSRVFAGTINGAGAIEVEVTRLSSETALAKVVQMVGEAETQKSPTQRFADRFERIFAHISQVRR
jgi:Cd2+/Zn2+-exporting ATPase